MREESTRIKNALHAEQEGQEQLATVSSSPVDEATAGASNHDRQLSNWNGDPRTWVNGSKLTARFSKFESNKREWNWYLNFPT